MKNIEFSIHPDLKGIKEIEPVPAKSIIPEWYKKISITSDENLRNRTIKACIPVLDAVTAGYLLRLPQDMVIQQNLKDDDGNPRTSVSFGLEGNQWIFAKGYNLNNGAEPHNVDQVGGKDTFYSKKTQNQGVPKILNPWVIKTPPGYSCIFLPPLHRETNDIFQILPGVVDTDIFPQQVNFPFHFNAEKNKDLKIILKMGTPYVQVIPFKRETWKMSTNYKHDKLNTKLALWSLKIAEVYKTLVWKKKSWK